MREYAAAHALFLAAAARLVFALRAKTGWTASTGEKVRRPRKHKFAQCTETPAFQFETLRTH